MQPLFSLTRNSLKARLIRIGLWTTTAALVLAFSILMARELLETRNLLVQDLKVQAKTIGDHSASALIFNDPKAASETLETLQSLPNIYSAVIYSQEGQIFAAYRKAGGKQEDPPQALKGKGFRFGWNTLILSQPIVFQNKRVGTVELRSDLRRFYDLVGRYLLTLGVTLLLSLAAAYFLLSRLHKSITAPLDRLIALMGVIPREKNFSLRAPEEGEDELRALARGFNDMLEQIQSRERELAGYRRHLEEEVEKRTRDLAMTNIRLEKELEDRQRAEKEKSLLEEQLRQSQKMEAIGRLAGGIAHDFNNLLTIIQGYCELAALKIGQKESVAQEIEQIRLAGNRAADLTRQLLAFSRRQILEMKVLDLNELLRNMQNMLSRLLGEDIQITLSLKEPLGKIKTDPAQIEQVIINLAVNARDAMPYGGQLTLTTDEVFLDQHFSRSHPDVPIGPYVKLSVSDTGSGMTPEVKSRLFEPFFTTKELGKGTGLGLSTIYGIIKQSGGTIWVESELYKGTTFEIYFPLLQETAEPEEIGLSPQGPLSGLETVLVVEDEIEVGKIIQKALETLGYRVILAGGGQEAWQQLQDPETPPIHLLLTDVVMPGMNGRELRDRLLTLNPKLKVIFMSGYTDDQVLRHGILKKEMHFLQKPFTVQALAQKIRQVLDEP